MDLECSQAQGNWVWHFAKPTRAWPWHVAEPKRVGLTPCQTHKHLGLACS